MKRVCLPRKERDEFVAALKSKQLNIADLYKMTSAERNAAFSKVAGEDFGKIINARFERAMVSKQRTAMMQWVKSTISAKDPIRRDMLKKVGKIEEVLTSGQQGDFLTDLAEAKLGLGVSEREAETIVRLKKAVDDTRMQVSEDAPLRSKERMEYGMALERFKKYVGELKLRADSLSVSERLSPKNYGTDIVDAAAASKGFVSTLDNSFIGRQGIKTLLNGNYRIWGDAVKTSFELFGKEMMQKSPGLFKDRGDAVMGALRADVFSRPNALNGKYAAAKNGYGLGVFHEEAFPSSLPSRIPFLGRVFKASESAFTGSAIKMRVELADASIAAAEKNGIDMLDETQATALGNLVTSLTGRGELTSTAAMGKEMNALLFAPRFLKANFNTLTAHTFDKTMTPYARKQAALSTARIAASITTLLVVADTLNPGSVEWDPRSTNFGKITIGSKRYDITGGMSGLIVLGSRMVPSFHNGEFGNWTKSPRTGKYTKMNSGDFGEQTAFDTFVNFFAGKLSPLAGAFRDAWKGSKYNGEKPTVVNSLTGLVVPISYQVLQEELAKGNDDLLFAMIAEGLGFSSTDSNLGAYGKRWNELKKNEGEKEMNQALKEMTVNFNKQAEKLQKSPSWKKMTNEEQAEALQKIKDDEAKIIFDSYGIK